MNRGTISLLLINIFAIIITILVLTNSQVLWVRGPIGIMMTLVFPGYILMELLFPRSSVDLFERLVLTIGLSVAISAVGGLLLYMAFGYLSSDTWIPYIVSVAVLGSGVLFYRRQQVDETENPTKAVDGHQRMPLKGIKILPLITRILPFALALAIVIGSIFYAQAVAKVQPITEVVQMWMIPDPGNPTHAVQIGVNTEKAIPNTYSIVLKRGNTTVRSWSNIFLKADDHWQMTVVLPASLPGTGPLEANLINPNSPAKLIRQVTLWPESLR